MSKIKSIEDLLVWQKARVLNKMIYSITAKFPSSERNNLVSQLRRATSSVCANIAEGFGRYHLQESMQFYRTAKGSLLEVRSHLYLAFDQNYLSEDSLKELLVMTDEIGKMLSGLITKTKIYRASKALSSSN